MLILEKHYPDRNFTEFFVHSLFHWLDKNLGSGGDFHNANFAGKFCKKLLDDLSSRGWYNENTGGEYPPGLMDYIESITVPEWNHETASLPTESCAPRFIRLMNSSEAFLPHAIAPVLTEDYRFPGPLICRDTGETVREYKKFLEKFRRFSRKSVPGNGYFGNKSAYYFLQSLLKTAFIFYPINYAKKTVFGLQKYGEILLINKLSGTLEQDISNHQRNSVDIRGKIFEISYYHPPGRENKMDHIYIIKILNSDEKVYSFTINHKYLLSTFDHYLKNRFVQTGIPVLVRGSEKLTGNYFMKHFLQKYRLGSDIVLSGFVYGVSKPCKNFDIPGYRLKGVTIYED